MPDAFRETTETLGDILNRRRLSIEEVLDWSCAVSAQLRVLHDAGKVYGAVAASQIAISGNCAHLEPQSPSIAVEPAVDVAEFAALLRLMLEHTDSHSGDWAILDRIAATNAHAEPDTRMLKVALTLRLLQSTRKTERLMLQAKVARASAAAASAPFPIRDRASGRGKPRRVEVGIMYISAFLASAAGIAVAGCLIFLRFIK